MTALLSITHDNPRARTNGAADPAISAKDALTGLDASQLVNLHGALATLENVCFALSCQPSFSDGDDINCAGFYLNDIRLLISERAEDVIERIRDLRPANRYDELCRGEALIRYEVENRPSLVAPLLQAIRQQQQDIV